MLNFKAKLSKELEDFKKEIETEKSLLKRELEVYKREKYAEVDADVEWKKRASYSNLDEVRKECYKTKAGLMMEIGQLEGKRDALKAEINKDQTDEIKRLNNIILELIKNQSKQSVVCCGRNS